MTREDFVRFVEQTLESAVQLAEEHSGKVLPRPVAFKWLGHDVVRENVVEHIVARVFVDEEHIYPCVDIGVGDLLDDGTPVIVGIIAGYSPRTFGKNWQDKEGPFIQVVGVPFLAKSEGLPVKQSMSFQFTTPGMKSLKRKPSS